MTKAKKRNLFAYGFCLISAALILLICTRNSYLYPLNPWCDVNCFVTVARGMMNGLIPYRDLMEQKGPLLYFLHVVGLWISPGDYHGFYLLEVVFMSASLYLAWQMMRLYLPDLNVGWIVPVGAVFVASRSMGLGDTAEEWCLPMMLASMYALLKQYRGAGNISLGRLILHGFLAGCVLWIKFNQLGVHFVFMAVLAIEAVITDRSIVRAIKMCGAFLLGMLLASVPWIVYFGLHGAIDDWLRVYIVENVFGYTRSNRSVVFYTLYGLTEGLKNNGAMAAVLVVGGVGVLLMPGKRMNWREKAFLILAAVFVSLAVYGGGRNYEYYFGAYACMLPFGLLPLLFFRRAKEKLTSLLKSQLMKRAFSAAMSLALMFGGVYYALNHSYNIGAAGTKYENTAHGIFASYIKQYEDRTLLNFGGLDQGFYFAADVLPINRYFCGLNNYPVRSAEDQMQVLENESVHFVVTTDHVLEDKLEKAKELMPEHEFKETSYELVMEMPPYYLYQCANGEYK